MSQPSTKLPSPTSDRSLPAVSGPYVGDWHWDLTQGAGQVGAAWCRRFALDPCAGPDHLAQWKRRVHPDDQAEFQHGIAELRRAAGGEVEIEYRLLTLENTWLWVLQRGHAHARAAASDPITASGICIDINSRKRAELELQDKETRLATALWGARAAFWQWHLPTDTATRSPLWFSLTGYTREQWESLPSPWTERMHPEDAPAVRRAVDDHLSGRSPSIEIQYRTRCANSAWKWMLDRGRVAEWDFDGKPLTVIGVSLEIDQQKRAELALRATESRLETAIWGAGFGLYELDCVSGSARWLNDWCERYDIEPCSGEAHFERWDRQIHPDDRESLTVRFDAHLLGSQQEHEAEYRVRTRSGAWRWMYERGRIVERDAGGRALRLMGICMDIDGYRRARAEADAASERLHFVLSRARGCLWELDLDSKQYNDAYYEYYGVDPLQARRDPQFWAHHNHPDDAPPVLAGERDVIAGRIAHCDAQYRMRQPDGSWRWLVDRFSVSARDEQGRPTRLSGLVLDITDEIASREAMRQSQRVLETVTANSVDWLSLLDTDLRFKFINRAVAGFPSEAIIGRTMEEIVPPDDPVMAAAREVLATGREVRAEIRRKLQNGDQVNLALRVGPVLGPKGVEGIVVNASDVSQLLNQRDQLGAQAQVLGMLLEGVLMLDAEQQVRVCNAAAAQLLDLAGESHVGTTRLQLELRGPPDLRRLMGQWLDDMATAGEPVRHFEIVYRQRDGSTRSLAAVTRAIELSGVPHQLLVLRDESARHQLERDVLEVAAREQRRLGYDLHDGLGQDLTGISLHLRSVANDSRPLDATLANRLEEVIGLVTDCIDTTRSMARGLSPVDVDSAGLIGALRTMALAVSSRNSIAVYVEDELANAPAPTSEQAIHFFRIAQEAVMNAVRHARATAIQIRFSRDAANFRLSIQDNGRGFPEHNSRVSEGLGLKTMRFRVQMLSGEMNVSSAAETGVRIECRCPVHSPAAL